MTTPTTLDVEALRTASDPLAALFAVLADDVEWIEVDQRTQPHAPSVQHGRAAVEATLREAHAAGLRSHVTDGFAAGDRAALTVTCASPNGARVLCNALVDLRGGTIARWFAVQAWDER